MKAANRLTLQVASCRPPFSAMFCPGGMSQQWPVSHDTQAKMERAADEEKSAHVTFECR